MYGVELYVRYKVICTAWSYMYGMELYVRYGVICTVCKRKRGSRVWGVEGMKHPTEKPAVASEWDHHSRLQCWLMRLDDRRSDAAKMCLFL